MLFVIRNWKVLVGLLLLVISFGAGWKLKPVPVIETASNESVLVEKIVTVEKRPDGTVITRIEDKKEQKKVVSVAAPKAVEKPKYSASVYAIPKWDDLRSPGWAIGAGRRLGDTNAWAVVEVNNKRDVMLGVRVDF